MTTLSALDALSPLAAVDTLGGPTATAPGAADHEWGPGAWWPVVPLLWALFWTGVVVTVVLVLRRRGPERTGRQVLADRYARGEIAEDEYAERLAALRRHRRG